MLAHETAALLDLSHAPSAVRTAIRAAGGGSSADFAYLVRTAAVESSFDPTAKSATSTASGMYQFVEATWLEMVENHGAKIGLGDHAAALRHGSAGQQQRQDILDLRYDPKTAAFMAQAYADDNRRHLEVELGRPAGMVDQYLAHFLGPSGATTFLTTLENRPGTLAAELLPAAAEANQAVFYESGRPRSVAEVHAYFSRKLGEPVDAEAYTSGWVASPLSHQAQPARADTPPFSVNSAFMVHVLLQALATDRLENAVQDGRSRDEAEPAIDHGRAKTADGIVDFPT